MSERLHQPRGSYGFDGAFRLYYGPELTRQLNPCEPIEDDEMLLGVIGNGTLNPSRLILLERDRKPIYVTGPETHETCSLDLPGKSAIILLDPTKCDKRTTQEIVEHMLDGRYDRRDHLHVATVKDIKSTGWIPYWAPLQLEGKFLHARLVCESSLEGTDPSEEETTRLAGVFQKRS